MLKIHGEQTDRVSVLMLLTVSIGFLQLKWGLPLAPGPGVNRAHDSTRILIKVSFLPRDAGTNELF